MTYRIGALPIPPAADRSTIDVQQTGAVSSAQLTQMWNRPLAPEHTTSTQPSTMAMKVVPT